MPKQEILPPRRNLPSADYRPQSAELPAPAVNGYLPSVATRFRAGYTTKALDALAQMHAAQARVYNVQATVVDAYISRRAALARLADLPERLTHELTLRRMTREGELQDARHHADMQRRGQERERTLAEAEQTNADTVLTLARVALADAEQQLEAQQNHGYYTHELAFNRKKLDMLDIELSRKERMALYREATQSKQRPAAESSEDEIDDALYARRDQLNAAGLDTTKVEEAIARRRKR
jgi:hypothetical protein